MLKPYPTPAELLRGKYAGYGVLMMKERKVKKSIDP